VVAVSCELMHELEQKLVQDELLLVRENR